MADAANNPTVDPEAQPTETPSDPGAIETEVIPVEPVETEPAEGDPAPTETPNEALDKRVQGLETAAAEERKKRQVAEQELEWLRAQQPQQPQQQQQQPQQPQVNWQQEDAEFWKHPAQYVHRTTEGRAEQIAANKMQALERRRLAASERRVAPKYEDYPQKLRAFNAMVQAEPWLWEQVADAPEPAEAMYQLVERRITYGTTEEEMRTKIAAEERAKLEAEKRGKRADAAAAGAVPTQAGARSSGSTAAQPDPEAGHILDDVLPKY